MQFRYESWKRQWIVWIESGYWHETRWCGVRERWQRWWKLQSNWIFKWFLNSFIELESNNAVHLTMLDDHLVVGWCWFSSLFYTLIVSIEYSASLLKISADDGWICKIVEIEVWARLLVGRENVEDLWGFFRRVFPSSSTTCSSEFFSDRIRVCLQQHKSLLRFVWIMQTDSRELTFMYFIEFIVEWKFLSCSKYMLAWCMTK